jgi:hypothetical protein
MTAIAGRTEPIAGGGFIVGVGRRASVDGRLNAIVWFEHAARIQGIIGAPPSPGNSRGRGAHSASRRLASQGFQKFFGREGLDQDKDTLRRNRFHRLRSGVASHHDGRNITAEGGTQVPDGLDTIR